MSQLQGNILYKLMPKDSNMTPAEPLEVKEVHTPEGKSVARNKEGKEGKEGKENIIASQEAKGTYCIVLASQVKRNNAEVFIEQVKKRGISDARINIDNGTLRVICGGYDNQSDAYNHLNKIATDIEFADAWVYKIKGV